MASIKLKHFALLLTVILGMSSVYAVAPDAITGEKEIGDGNQPNIAIDAKNSKMHLIYIGSSGLMYRVGTIGGLFGPPEKVMSAGSSDPRIALDRNGDPHVVVSTSAYQGATILYSNRIGGRWKPQITALSSQCGLGEKDRAITPSIAIDSDLTVYVSAFMGCLCSITGAATSPTRKVLRQKTGWWGHSQLFCRPNGELWVFKGEPYGFQKLSKATLKEDGGFIKAGPCGAEQFRASMAPSGELHAAGGCIGSSSTNRGWYNSLSRAQAGKSPLRYNSTNGHECGAQLPAEDLATSKRVYVAYWSGGAMNQYGVKTGCIENNKLMFARIEDGTVASQGTAVASQAVSKTLSYRSTPCIAALPGGGAVMVAANCGTNKMYLVYVGASITTSTGQRAAPARARTLDEVPAEAFDIRGRRESGCVSVDPFANQSRTRGAKRISGCHIVLTAHGPSIQLASRKGDF